MQALDTNLPSRRTVIRHSHPVQSAACSRQCHAQGWLCVSASSAKHSRPAGTGKSLVLRQLVAALPPSSTFVTAPTALAACALGGTTIHAFGGLGRAEGDLPALIRAASRPDALKRWRACSVLIVDEVSVAPSVSSFSVFWG